MVSSERIAIAGACGVYTGLVDFTEKSAASRFCDCCLYVVFLLDVWVGATTSGVPFEFGVYTELIGFAEKIVSMLCCGYPVGEVKFGLGSLSSSTESNDVDFSESRGIEV